LGGKVLEEAQELVEAADGKTAGEVINEAADLAYHTLVLLAKADVSPEQVKLELARRFGKGGLEEKASRKT